MYSSTAIGTESSTTTAMDSSTTTGINSSTATGTDSSTTSGMGSSSATGMSSSAAAGTDSSTISGPLGLAFSCGTDSSIAIGTDSSTTSGMGSSFATGIDSSTTSGISSSLAFSTGMNSSTTIVTDKSTSKAMSAAHDKDPSTVPLPDSPPPTRRSTPTSSATTTTATQPAVFTFSASSAIGSHTARVFKRTRRPSSKTSAFFSGISALQQTPSSSFVLASQHTPGSNFGTAASPVTAKTASQHVQSSSFGVPVSSVTAATASQHVQGSSFGVPVSSVTAATASQHVQGSSFGVPVSTVTAAAASQHVQGSSFGVPVSTVTAAAASQHTQGSSFGAQVSSVTSTTTPSQHTPGSYFGAQVSSVTAATASQFTTGFSSGTPVSSVTATTSALFTTGISFGIPVSSVTASQLTPGVSLGAPVSSITAKTVSQLTPGFSLRASVSSGLAAASSQLTASFRFEVPGRSALTTTSSQLTPRFNLGAPVSSVTATPASQLTSGFSFGASVTSVVPTTSSQLTPSVHFGAPVSSVTATTASQLTSGFSFGSSVSSVVPTTSSQLTPSVHFGAPVSSGAATTVSQLASKYSFEAAAANQSFGTACLGTSENQDMGFIEDKFLIGTACEPKEAECPICHEYFSNPKILPCGHLLCRNCATSWLEFNTEARCPMCHCAIVDPTERLSTNCEELVELLPTDLTMAALVDSARTLNEDRVCCVCIDVAAISLCLHCGDMFCQACAKVHQKQSATRDHCQKDLASLTAERLAALGRTCELFCPTHNVAVCEMCAATKHRACPEVRELQEGVKEARGSLEELAAMLRDKENEVERALKKLDEHLDQTEMKTQAALADIDAACDRMQSSVEACRRGQKKLARGLKSYLETSGRKLKTVFMEQCGKMTSHRQLVERAKRTAPPACLDVVTNTLQTKVKDIVSNTSGTADAAHVMSAMLLINEAIPREIEEKMNALVKIVFCSLPLFEDTQMDTSSVAGVLRFVENHSKSIKLSNNQQTAERVDDSVGIVVCSQEMEVDKLYQVVLEEKGTETDSLGMVTGVTVKHPATITLPVCGDYDWKDAIVVRSFLVDTLGSRTFTSAGEKLEDMPVGSCVGVLVDAARCLHLYVDGSDQGVVARDVPHPCYAFFRLLNCYKKITTLPVTPIERSIWCSAASPKRQSRQ